MKLRAGDWVEVKGKEDILKTLDSRGQMEGLPFMPQMFQYCGQRFKVYKRAHKTCDTVNTGKGRRMSDAVHLDLRCDGAAYGGCQAACLIFWKTAWLKPIGRTEGSIDQLANSASCTEGAVWVGTRKEDTGGTDGPRYVCQATQLPFFTKSLAWWDIRQYVEDYTSKNIAAGQMFRGFVYTSYHNLIQAGIGLGPPLRWLYDQIQSLWGGLPYPRRSGTIPVDQPTPARTVDLKPGELVRVKTFKEILATLNTANKNRGLYFDAEAVPYCGGTYRVRNRVHKFIDEKTGKLITSKNSPLILEGVSCQARYSDCRMFCPRSILSWWREIWLERLPTEPQLSSTSPRNEHSTAPDS